MNRYVIATGTVTHAVKGKEILKNNGIEAKIERMKYGADKFGCGYSLVFKTGNIYFAENLLKNNNVKVLMVNKLD